MLKQRIVGAVVLVATAAVLWPLVFDKTPPRTISTTTKIPEPPVIEEVISSRPVLEVLEQEVDFGRESQEDSAQPEENGSADIKTQTAVNAQGVPVAWSVRVATFSRSDNAVRLVEQLKDAGFTAYARPRGDSIRVYVGPKLNKAIANEQREAIKQQFDLDGIVVRFQP